jgi:hypothetical protein
MNIAICGSSWVGSDFEHLRLGTITVLDESSNLWRILQHESGHEFWIRKSPTKEDSQLMKESGQQSFLTPLLAMAA